MVKYQFWVKKTEHIWVPVVEDNSKKAHSTRSEIAKDLKVIGVTPVRPTTDTTLPMELMKVVKRAREMGGI